MAILLRAVGLIWIFMGISPLVENLRHGFHGGFPLDVTSTLNLAVLAGGAGLLGLKSWGRLLLLAGMVGFLLLLTGPLILELRIGAYVIRNWIFYGLFIFLLNLPQAKQITR